MSEEIMFEKFKFSDFSILDTSTVRIKVTLDFFDFTEEDKTYIKDTIERNLGK